MTRSLPVLLATAASTTPMLLRVAALTLRRADRELVRDLDHEVGPGDRWALVGRNGVGKSTLLAALAGDVTSVVAGAVRRAPGTWWVAVGQDEGTGRLPASGSLFDLAAEALAPLRALGAELTAAALTLGAAPPPAALAAYGSLQSEFEARGGYEAEARLDEALARVRLDQARSRPARTASGGERRRARLAGALAAGTDLLLLDEPTNHLDIEARAWLTERLRTFRGAVVFAAHDRTLIDAVASHVLVLGDGRSPVRRGGWTAWQRDAEVALRSDAKTTRARARRIAELDALALTLRSHGHRTAHTRRRRAEREADALRTVSTPATTVRTARLDLDADTAGGALARFEHLTSGAVLDDVALTLDAGDRLALLGPNGSGKSTLLRLLAGEASSEDARAHTWWRPGTRVVYVDQHRRGLPDDATPRSVLGAWVRDARVEALLALVGLPYATFDRRIDTLSGGERARASAALLMAREADVLLLDEPTNDLDLPTIEALEAALRTTGGAVVVATHDARTVEALAAEVVTIEAGRLVRWRGGLAGWRRGARRREAGLVDDGPTPNARGDPERATSVFVADEAPPDPAALDAARLEVDAALEDPLRWSDRERGRWLARRRSLEEALLAAWDLDATPPEPRYRTRERGWRVWAERTAGGLRVWLDGDDARPPTALDVRILDANGRRIAHLVPSTAVDRELATWAWQALASGAARLAFYVADVEAVQVGGGRDPGDDFRPWAPRWWWWTRADLERTEGWRPTAAPGEGPHSGPRGRKRRGRRRVG